jgi:hypothetical protein
VPAETWVDLVAAEVERALRLYSKPFNSAHEGISVLREEFEELWDEVKRNQAKGEQKVELMKAEAIQVAAMAVRFLIDICGVPQPDSTRS